MKKGFIVLAVIAAVVTVLFISLRLTGVVQYYVTPTGANAPNIKMGEHFFATRLRKPKLFDFICFTALDPMSNKKEIYVSRLCAVSGDKVEMKDGLLFVNDQRTDYNIPLTLDYMVAQKDLPVIKQAGIDDVENIINVGADSAVIHTTESHIKDHKIAARLIVYPKEYTDDMISQKWGEQWNADQFGPVVVPANCYFLLGDNRHNSMDSRYRGFIPISDYRATVLK